MWATLPRLSHSELLPGSAYGLAWSEGTIGGVPRVQEKVGLTVAGFYHLEDEKGFGQRVIDVVRTLAARERQLTPDPHEVVTATFSSTNYEELLAVGGKAPPPGYLDLIRDVLQHEPPTWGTVAQGAPGQWATPLSVRLRNFLNVQAIDDYLDRIVAMFPQRGTQLAPSIPLTPMALPNSLGYLDVVWRLWHGDALIGHSLPGPFARLALPCSDSEGFDSRLSALSEVFGAFRIPEAPSSGKEKKDRPGTLEQMREHLTGSVARGETVPSRVSDPSPRSATRIRVGEPAQQRRP